MRPKRNLIILTTLVFLIIIALLFFFISYYEKESFALFGNPPGSLQVSARCVCVGTLSVLQSYPTQYSCFGFEYCNDYPIAE